MKTLKDLFCSKAYPVEGLTYWGNGCYTVKRVSKLQGKYNAKRGKIVKLSTKSLTRLILVAQTTPVKFSSMLTLTYPAQYAQDGIEIKKDLSYIIKYMTRTHMLNNYLWFLEFQTRGAPHFHILSDNGVITPEWRRDAAWAWAKRVVYVDVMANHRGMVPPLSEESLNRIYNTELTKCFKVNADITAWQYLRSDEGARHYVTKYAVKQFQKVVPPLYANVGRFWGANRNVKPDPVWTVDACEEDIKLWLADKGHVAANWDMLPTVLFNVKENTDD